MTFIELRRREDGAVTFINVERIVYVEEASSGSRIVFDRNDAERYGTFYIEVREELKDIRELLLKKFRAV